MFGVRPAQLRAHQHAGAVIFLVEPQARPLLRRPLPLRERATPDDQQTRLGEGPTHEAVAAAYGLSADLSDDDLLSNLLALNVRRTGTTNQ